MILQHTADIVIVPYWFISKDIKPPLNVSKTNRSFIMYALPLHGSGTADADPDGMMSAPMCASGPYANLIDVEACTAKTTGKSSVGAG